MIAIRDAWLFRHRFTIIIIIIICSLSLCVFLVVVLVVAVVVGRWHHVLVGRHDDDDGTKLSPIPRVLVLWLLIRTTPHLAIPSSSSLQGGPSGCCCCCCCGATQANGTTTTCKTTTTRVVPRQPQPTKEDKLLFVSSKMMPQDVHNTCYNIDR